MKTKSVQNRKSFGSLNFKKGIKNKNTKPILKEAIKIGGTESFKTSFDSDFVQT